MLRAAAALHCFSPKTREGKINAGRRLGYWLLADDWNATLQRPDRASRPKQAGQAGQAGQVEQATRGTEADDQEGPIESPLAEAYGPFLGLLSQLYKPK